MMNILSNSEMYKQHQITYDLMTEDVFIVHLPDKQVKFSKMEQGLYIFKQTTNAKVFFVNIVNKNQTIFVHQQFEN